MEETITVTNTKKVNKQMGRWYLAPGVPTKVPLEFITLFGMDKELLFDFSNVPDYLQSRNTSGDLLIDWISPLSMVDGYGRHAIWLVRALLREGVDVNLRDVGWVDNLYMPPDIRSLRSQSSIKLPSRIGVAFTLGYDQHICTHPSPIKIAITQFETNKLPYAHVANVNQCDHVLVTSKFGVKVFRDSGVKIPIDVMPPGVDTDYFQYVDRPRDGQFKVLMVGALTPRKNPEGAIRIFQRASEGNPDWRLTIKTRAAAGIHRVRKMASSDGRIKLIISDDHPDQILEYYRRHDCLLWPSKGEGVGLPPLEAMSTGMELVCSDNSGMSDYVHSDHCYPIKMSGLESAAGPDLFTKQYIEVYGDVGQWWTVNEDHAVKQLAKCYDNWWKGNGKGRRAADYVRENHTLAHSARAIVEVVEKYA